MQKSGYSDVLKDMMRKLRHANETITFADVLKDTAAKNGYGNLFHSVLPAVRYFYYSDSALLPGLRHDSDVSGQRCRDRLFD